MRLPGKGDVHLTYCTNIHPAETWPETQEALRTHVREVKRRVSPNRPFGVGLRLSATAAAGLADPEELEAFRSFLRENELYVFTINGFPFGRFHDTHVKEGVYLPDWLDERRLEYSDLLAKLLSSLLPHDVEGSISTVPGAFRPRVGGRQGAAAMADRLVRHAAALHRIRQESGKTVRLALEPEPGCFLETCSETIAFFEEHLFGRASRERLARLAGIPPAQAEEALRRHLAVCLDACHAAVVYEEPAETAAALIRAGIRIAKIQVSAALVADRRDRDGLGAFASDVYLHQVVERRPTGAAAFFLDLPDALAAPGAHPAEWRIHFHVPVFLEEIPPFRTTQPQLRRLLAAVERGGLSDHLEVETYTWDVLPAGLREGGVSACVAREMEWVRQVLRR